MIKSIIKLEGLYWFLTTPQPKLKLSPRSTQKDNFLITIYRVIISCQIFLMITNHPPIANFNPIFFSACLEGYKASPYPEVDAFLLEHVRKLEPNGGIRHWTYFSQGELIVYEMANYRFCHNVERSHKSNNVM